MSEKPIDKLESQLETLVEGAFVHLFRRTVSAREVAIMLLRVMEDKAAQPTNGFGKGIAPNIYRISLHPDTAHNFLSQYPNLPARLARLIMDLAIESSFQLQAEPQVIISISEDLSTIQPLISAEHSPAATKAARRQRKGLPRSHKITSLLLARARGFVKKETEAMQSVQEPQHDSQVRAPLLYVNSNEVVELIKTVIDIGRETGNDIVVDDAYVSRHHLQLRKRFGVYTLFDVESRGGTRVNNTSVREHRLQNGDVIQIGQTRLVYADHSSQHIRAGTTQVLIPD